MPVPRPVTTGAGAPGEGGDQRGRRRGVADAHLAGDEEVVAVGDEHARDLGPDVERGEALRRSSSPASCAMSPVPGRTLRTSTPAELTDVGRDADVDDMNRRADLTGRSR